MSAYTVEKHRGLWWVIDAEGYEARSVGYETKTEALQSAKIVEQEDAAYDFKKQAFIDKVMKG
jgi:hypothetical protein